MVRYVAFLRAINVGGHAVKMERLRALFQSLGFDAVETFIASGNVIFESPARSTAMLEQKIERLLEPELGYAVKTFIRSDVEVAEIAKRVPFGNAASQSPATLFIGFLSAAPAKPAEQRLLAAQTPIDEFGIVDRELYWRCGGASHESTFSGPKLEKTIGMPTTIRNANTVRRIAAKYPPRD